MKHAAYIASGVITALVSHAEHTHAGEWTNSAGLALGSYVSSNICRSPDDEEDKVVGTFTPSVDVTGEGARFNLRLDAAAEYNSLGDSSIECPQGGAGFGVDNQETWVPRINFNSELESLENLLFLEADATASQNPINPFAAGGNDNINGTGNQNITYQWGAGARVDRRLAEQWAVFARYNYNEQYNSFNEALGDSQADLVNIDIGMVPEASRFSAGLRGEYQEVFFEETQLQPEFTNRLSNLELRAAQQLSRSWQLNAYGGEEDNVFLSSSDETDGSYWDVGARWTPNERVSVNVGYGERFFGETPRFDIQYRHKRSQFSASYARDLQFPRDLRAAGTDLDDPLESGGILPGDPLGSTSDPTFIGQSPILNESFSLRYSFVARRTSLNLQISDSRQTQARDGREGTFQNASLVITRALGQSISGDIRLSWRKNEGDDVDGVNVFFQDLESWDVGAGLQRRLAKSTVLSLRYLYTDTTSSFDLNTFEEHRVQLGLRLEF